jgi:hypothetical protein|tara:strand:+ start:171 stop:599 length:429 start_codon:yes stop_codon:yes gene_type:complete
MNKFSWIAASILVSTAMPLSAEQMKEIEGYKVHYIAFGSTFLTPAIAKQYGIERSRYGGVVNISVQNPESTSVEASVSGVAKNLVGQKKSLTFKEIHEGTVTYYIAPFTYANEETLNFEIAVDPEGPVGTDTLTFSQKFYVD